LSGARLCQGEILSGLIQVRQSLSSIGGTEDPSLNELEHPYAIVFTQDCDLEQDWTARTAGQVSQLFHVLFCETETALVLKGKVQQGKDIWKRIIANNDLRYQCLESVPKEQDALGEGLPALGCDFRRYFTIPVDEVYERIKLGQIRRRCKLRTPYAEHLLSRFCNYQARVPLPEPHDVPLAPPA
jgi:hypothetical protein